MQHKQRRLRLQVDARELTMRAMQWMVVCFVSGLSLWPVASSAQSQQELECQAQGTHDCTGFTVSRGFFKGANGGGVCAEDPPPLDPEPIGTFSHRPLSAGFLSEAEAANYSDLRQRCMNPIDSNFTGQGPICKYEGTDPAGDWEITGWWDTAQTQIAHARRPYNWKFKVRDANGCSPTVHSVQAYYVEEYSLRDCAPGTSSAPASNGEKFCWRNRVCPDCLIGNPIALGVNEKRLVEKDYEGSGPFPLRVVRHYGSQAGNSLGESPMAVHPLGRGWRTQYHRGVFTYQTALVKYYTVRREDGESRVFNDSPQNGVLSLPLEKGRLEKNANGFIYHTPDEDTEVYDVDGKLQSITTRDGLRHTITYGQNGFNVADDFGHVLQFAYDPLIPGRITSVTTPDGVVTYDYKDDSGLRDTDSLRKVTRPDGSQRIYKYGPGMPTLPWAVTNIVDEAGHTISTYGYDLTTGRAVSTQQTGANPYSVSGTDIADVTDPRGTHRTYTFTANTAARAFLLTNRAQPEVVDGNVTGQTTNEHFIYDANGNLSERTDDKGNRTQYTIPSPRNVETQRVEAFGTAVARTISTDWLATARLPKRIAEPLRITTYAYNGEPGVSCAPPGASTTLLCSKAVQATTDVNGTQAFQAPSDGTPRTTSYTYDVSGRVLSIDGPRTDVPDITTMTYYPNDHPCVPCRQQLQTLTRTVTNTPTTLTHVTQFANYFASGRVQKMIDPNGLETLFDYWPNKGQLKTRQVGTAAAGYETTQYNVDSAGLLRSVTTPDGSTVLYEYDAAQRLVKVSDGLGNRIEYTLDDMGNRKIENAYDSTPQQVLVRTHSRDFDVLNRLKKDTGGTTPATPLTQYAYDNNGNLTKTTDSLNRDTKQSYDPLNRLTQIIDPFNGTAAPTGYEYNGQNQVTRVTDPSALATTYVYNGHGELKSQSSPDTGVTTYTYDAASNLTSKTDARNSTANYTYDALNRLTRIVYPDETVTYTYDCAGNLGRLCSITDRSGTTTYTYNVKGRVATKTQVVDGVTHTVSYDYNAAGQLTTITYPSRHQVVYGYANNRPVSITIDGTKILDGVFYEPFGPNGGWRWGNSIAGATNTHTRLYDKDFRPARITSDRPLHDAFNPAFDRQYYWDSQSRLTQIWDYADTNRNTSYTFYDGLDRLNLASLGNTTWSYSFNGTGDRTQTYVNTTATTYSYFAGTHRLQSLSGGQTASYSYDNAGNATSVSGGIWTYGGNNRPTQVGLLLGFSFNALGQRVKKATPSGNTRFVYDEAGRLLGEYTETGGTFTETVWLGELPVAVIR